MTTKALLVAERRAVRRYTYLLWFSLHATRAERERWKGLRNWHERQVQKWETYRG